MGHDHVDTTGAATGIHATAFIVGTQIRIRAQNRPQHVLPCTTCLLHTYLNALPDVFCIERFMPGFTSTKKSKTARNSEGSPVSSPKENTPPASYLMLHRELITLDDVITQSKGRSMKQTADAFGISVTTLQRMLKHFEVGTWPEFKLMCQAYHNAVGPAPGNGAAAAGSVPGNGAAAAGSVPGNGTPQAPSPLFTPDGGDVQSMWSPSPVFEKEFEVELPGDQNTDDERMSIEDEKSPAGEENPLAEAQDPTEDIPADGGALNGNDAAVHGYKPWPYGFITNVNPTEPLHKSVFEEL